MQNQAVAAGLPQFAEAAELFVTGLVKACVENFSESVAVFFKPAIQRAIEEGSDPDKLYTPADNEICAIAGMDIVTNQPLVNIAGAEHRDDVTVFTFNTATLEHAKKRRELYAQGVDKH